MNTLDIVICLLAAFFVVRGLFRGLVLELSGIAGLAAGLYIANKYSALVEPLLGRFLTDNRFLPLVAFLATFMTVLFLTSMLGLVLRRILRFSMLTWADHVFGGLFGLLKSALLISVAVIALVIISPRAEVVGNSLLRPYLMPVVDRVAGFLPSGLHNAYLRNKAVLPATGMAKPFGSGNGQRS